MADPSPTLPLLAVVAFGTVAVIGGVTLLLSGACRRRVAHARVLARAERIREARQRQITWDHGDEPWCHEAGR